MKWILLILLTDRSLSAEFESRAACEHARTIAISIAVEHMSYTKSFAESDIVCVPKGDAK